MDPQQQNPQGYGQFTAEQPVAYDQYGNPLYAHPMQQVQATYPQQQAAYPQQQQYPQQPIAAPGGNHHIPRPDTSPEAERLHEESVKKYPDLNLSVGEYVVHSVTRHPVGIVKIWAIAAALVAALALLLVGFLHNDSFLSTLGIFDNTNTPTLIAAFLVALVSVLGVVGALVASYVYSSNKLYLTSESVIQEVRETVFANFTQTVTLSNIEDVSYHQDGIFPTMFNYGVIRLSTVGDESTYRFTYVANPKHESAILNNAVESYKRGLPVGLPDASAS